MKFGKITRKIGQIAATDTPKKIIGSDSMFSARNVTNGVARTIDKGSIARMEPKGTSAPNFLSMYFGIVASMCLQIIFIFVR